MTSASQDIVIQKKAGSEPADGKAPGVRIEDSIPALRIHSFSDKFMQTTIHFQFIFLQGSFMLWIGDAPRLSNLSVALTSTLDDDPSATTLLGGADAFSSGFAQRLTKRSGLIAFVSYNLDENQQFAEAWVEKRALQELALCQKRGICDVVAGKEVVVNAAAAAASDATRAAGGAGAGGAGAGAARADFAASDERKAAFFAALAAKQAADEAGDAAAAGDDSAAAGGLGLPKSKS